MFIINPGSENRGGTKERAIEIAKEWYDNMVSNGFTNIGVKYIGKVNNNFLFNFIHKTTGKIATLETHGLTKEECKNFPFSPRIYWNGSSGAIPQINDFITDEYTYEITYRKIKQPKPKYILPFTMDVIGEVENITIKKKV